jgi:lysophospholipase L1-like esterase
MTPLRLTPGRKTAAALATAVALLAAWHFLAPTKGLSPNIFPEAAHVSLLRHNPASLPGKPRPTEPTTTAGPLNGIQQPTTSGRLPQISAFLIDDSNALAPFFAALHALELPPAGGPAQVVTVLHYGDSPTTADLITGDVRALLQQRFGDAGAGFLLVAKPWAWYQHRNIDLADHNWTISTPVGKGREEVYGIGGASFEGDSAAGTRITLKVPQSTLELAYLARPNGGSVAISANNTPVQTIDTEADTPHPAWRTLSLPSGTRTVDLKPEGAPVRLFGETLRTGRRGVLYDSLGLNGASTTVLSNGFNASAWSAALQHERPALVIVNYGTNESGFGAFVDKQYEPVLRATIARIRAALPTTPILIMSPMDRGQRSGVDQIQTFDTIPRIVAIQRRVAADTHCAFFDTFNAMGGDGTMSRWYTGHPRLVAGDLIHPTPQGAALVAQLFVKDLFLGYNRYLSRPSGAPATRPRTPRIQTRATEPTADSTPATPPSTPPGATSTPAAPGRPEPSAAGEPVPSAPEPPSSTPTPPSNPPLPPDPPNA